METRKRIFQAAFVVAVSLSMCAMGRAQQMSDTEAGFWVQDMLFTAGTAHALGQGAYAPSSLIIPGASLSGGAVSPPTEGDPAAFDIFGLHWFTNLMVSSAAANSAAQAQTAFSPWAGLFGSAQRDPQADQIWIYNSRAQSTSAEELLLNLMLNMNANDPRLTSSTPAATQATTSSLPQTVGTTVSGQTSTSSTTSSDGLDSARRYGEALQAGMY
jgi:hypothetical protein